MTPRAAKTIIATLTQTILSIGNIHPPGQQKYWALPLQLNRTIVSYPDMRHFIVRMISTSTEKEEEHEGKLIGTDVERGFIDIVRAG
jgi:hypothetical protein